MSRITKKDVEIQARLFVALFPKRKLFLVHNTVYGYHIAEDLGDGREGTPFGLQSFKANEMYDILWHARRAIEIYNKDGVRCD